MTLGERWYQASEEALQRASARWWARQRRPVRISQIAGIAALVASLLAATVLVHSAQLLASELQAAAAADRQEARHNLRIAQRVRCAALPATCSQKRRNPGD